MIRQYINITNKCNANCSFCCMWSSSDKNTFMSFNTFKDIIDSHDDYFELQLEGGEPLLHKDLYLFMEYARSSGRCKKIIILTNGFLLDKHLKKFIAFSRDYNIPILIKMSINYHLLSIDKDLINKASNYHSVLEFTPLVDILLNVRLRHEDDSLREEIIKRGMDGYSNIFYLQSYGMYEDEEDYEKPVIVQNIDDWFIYSCDGKCFNQDLIARSNYEKELR